MKIGNIIYESELVNHKEVEYINYYRINDNQSIPQEVDYSLPTLIVGWKFLNNHFPDLDVNVLSHKITDNKLYWEFSFDENKSSHVSGIESFIDNVPKFYFTPQYSYKNLDPVFYQIKDNQDLYDILPSKVELLYKFKDRMLYILTDDVIYGLDLEMYKFFKFNIQGILDRLLILSKKPPIIDSEGDKYQEYYKIFPEFSYLKRYLVVILSK